MDLNPNDPNNRPPYVQFKTVAIEDRAQSLAQGHYVAKDVILAQITRPGQRDTVEREVTQWLADLDKQAQDGRIPPHWATQFRQMYETYKTGETPPENGTPIKGWQLLSPAQQQVVLKAGIRTVEDLATASAEALGHIGMGAITWQQKAKTWLTAAKDTGQIVERLQTLERDNAQLAKDNELLLAEIRRLKDAGQIAPQKGKVTL